ncbi:type II toxin-antitoxin system RelE/ParE family toxin [Jiella mangrovi]|uniref:Type II toxin-antitoxin system RelE/ParE family toxin n=1 Tax=Jiella mangrovi TaxID=2821407 RepID=A0ABS4BJ26_9HYPH|nr:type II toxin-antitoxin system RelE/ParE family toxin [Jiella mangrovi]MBP0616773.1 type II toxin-antitoxin system RelE/ParE family toxin [Jiella mangrovi]
MKLRYTTTALRQIDDALAYVADHSPQGASNLRKRLVSVLALLQDHPLAGQATSRPQARRVVLAPYPYVLFYRIGSGEIVVTRFRHAARKNRVG